MEKMHQLFIQWGWNQYLNDNWSRYGAALSTIILTFLVAFLVDFICKKYVIKTVKIFVEKSKFKWDDILFQKRTFERIAHLGPALVVYLSAPLVYKEWNSLKLFIEKFVVVYIIFLGSRILLSALSALEESLRSRPSWKDKPLKSYVQVICIFVYLITAIFSFSVVMDRSPWGLISSLGAMTAIIMLVFKDSILGFVASVQLAGQNMVRLGDWIEMPRYGADGDIIDISLNTVKVQNWDKTISTIPTYALITESFKNWRGMTESGGRRIKRSISIDIESVRFLTESDIEKLQRLRPLHNYLKEKKVDIQTYHEKEGIQEDDKLNQRRLTNLGTFRAYVAEYLNRHPLIHPNMTQIVRYLPPNSEGVPLEIYVFSKDQNWNNFERLQADIMDHIFAIIGDFGLRVFQKPSGFDMQSAVAQIRKAP